MWSLYWSFPWFSSNDFPWVPPVRSGARPRANSIAGLARSCRNMRHLGSWPCPREKRNINDLEAVLGRADARWLAGGMVVIVVKVQHKGPPTRLLARRGEIFLAPTGNGLRSPFFRKSRTTHCHHLKRFAPTEAALSITLQIDDDTIKKIACTRNDCSPNASSVWPRPFP